MTEPDYRQQQEQEEQEQQMNIYQRMHKVMEDVSYVQKEEKKVNGQYSFVSHDAVTAKLRPALLRHGILVVPSVESYVQDGNRTEAKLIVSFVNIDEPADRIAVEAFGFGIDPQDKGPGKAVSYAFKYALLKAFCLETGDDPERDMIPHEPKVSAGVIKPTDGAGDSLSSAQLERIDRIVSTVVDCFEAGIPEEAYKAIDQAQFDADEKTYLWSKLDSKQRSALKKIGEAKRFTPLHS